MLVAAARRHAIRCSEVTLGCGNRRFRGGSTGDFGRAACGAGGGGGLTLYAGRADACTAAVVGIDGPNFLITVISMQWFWCTPLRTAMRRRSGRNTQ